MAHQVEDTNSIEMLEQHKKKTQKSVGKKPIKIHLKHNNKNNQTIIMIIILIINEENNNNRWMYKKTDRQTDKQTEPIIPSRYREIKFNFINHSMQQLAF